MLSPANRRGISCSGKSCGRRAPLFSWFGPIPRSLLRLGRVEKWSASSARGFTEEETPTDLTARGFCEQEVPTVLTARGPLWRRSRIRVETHVGGKCGLDDARGLRLGRVEKWSASSARGFSEQATADRSALQVPSIRRPPAISKSTHSQRFHPNSTMALPLNPFPRKSSFSAGGGGAPTPKRGLAPTRRNRCGFLRGASAPK